MDIKDAVVEAMAGVIFFVMIAGMVALVLMYGW